MKLEIRKLELEDLPFLSEVREECREYLHTNVSFSLFQTIDWFKTLKTPYFLITLDDVKIGYFRTSEWKSDGSVCIGADLHKDFRGRGLAKAAYYLFLDYLSHHLGVERVWLEVLCSNARAFRLYKDLGFTVTKNDGHSIRMEKGDGVC